MPSGMYTCVRCTQSRAVRSVGNSWPLVIDEGRVCSECAQCPIHGPNGRQGITWKDGVPKCMCRRTVPAPASVRQE